MSEINGTTSAVFIHQKDNKLSLELAIQAGDDDEAVKVHAILAAAITVKYRDAQSIAELLDWFTSLSGDNADAIQQTQLPGNETAH